MNRGIDFKMKLFYLPSNHTLSRYIGDHKTLVYSYARWKPVVPNRRKLPFVPSEVIGRKMPLLRTLDIKPGLADITRETSRIQDLFPIVVGDSQAKDATSQPTSTTEPLGLVHYFSPLRSH